MVCDLSLVDLRDEPGADRVPREALDRGLVRHAANEFAVFGERVQNHQRAHGRHQHVVGELHLDIEHEAAVVGNCGEQLSRQLVVVEVGLGSGWWRLRFGLAALCLTAVLAAPALRVDRLILRAALFLAPVLGAGAHERPQALLERSGIKSLFAVVLDPVDGLGQRVEAGEHGVDDVVRERAGALAEKLEHLLHLMRELGDCGETHRRAHALERVSDPEDLIDRRAVLWVLLKRDDRDVEFLEVLARLGEEHRHVLGGVHHAFLKMNGWADSRPRADGFATRSVAPTIR